MNYAASILLETLDGKIILQHRDNKPDIIHPNMYCFFGGHSEGNEVPTETAIRELEEETTIKLSESELKFLAYVELDNEGYHPYPKRQIDEVCFVAKGIDPNKITVNEGQGMLLVSKTDDLSKINMTTFCRFMIYLHWGI